jgi:hypothetical protein
VPAAEYPRNVASSFAVRLRAYAAAHFSLDEHLTIQWPDATGILQSEYTGGTTGRAYAVTLFGEIRGSAESLDEAQVRLGGSLGNVLPIVALAANAAIADPIPIAAFGLDVSKEPQEFMWYAVPDAKRFFPPGLRQINGPATLALMAGIGTHPQATTLQRAVESYRRALENWVPERMLMAGEFLYVAAETLSRFLIEARSAEKGITPKNLARLMGESGPDALRERYLTDEVFGADEAALAAMRDASDGFEHGYMDINDVRGLIESKLERSMAFVRRSLVRAASIAADMESILLSSEYDQPRGLVPPIFMLRGDLTLKDPALPPPPDLGPLELDLPLPEPTAIEKGSGEPVEIKFQPKMTVLSVPENVNINVRGAGLRAAHVKGFSSEVSDVHRTEPEAPADDS